MQITFNIPDSKAQTVITAFCTRFGWSTDMGVTKAQFAKNKISEFIMSNYKDYLVQQAQDTATNALDVIIDIT